MTFQQTGPPSFDRLFHANFPNYVGGGPSFVPFNKSTPWQEERAVYMSAPAKQAYFSPNGVRLDKPRDNSYQTNVDLKKYEGAFYPVLAPAFGADGGQPGWQRDSGAQTKADQNVNAMQAACLMSADCRYKSPQLAEASHAGTSEAVAAAGAALSAARLDAQVKAAVRAGHSEQAIVEALKAKAVASASSFLDKNKAVHLDDFLQKYSVIVKQSVYA